MPEITHIDATFVVFRVPRRYENPRALTWPTTTRDLSAVPRPPGLSDSDWLVCEVALHLARGASLAPADWLMST